MKKFDDIPEIPTFEELDELPADKLQDTMRNLYILDDQIFDNFDIDE